MLQQDYANQSGIVYCFSRKECKKLSKLLSEHGVSAKAYHAGLDDSERRRVQQEWMEGDLLVVVATVVFGMGIDKPNVRFVIYHSIPQSIEGYFQHTEG